MKQGFPLWVVANMKMFFRDRTTLFWAIVFPILLMGLLGLGFGRSQAVDFRVGVIDEDHSTWSAALWTTLTNTSLPFKVSNYTDEGAARSAVARGDLDLVAVIPAGFGQFIWDQRNGTGDPNASFAVRVLWGVTEQGTGAIGVSTLSEVLDRFYQAATLTPKKLAVDAEPLNQQSLQYIDFLAPGIVAMSIMQNGVFGLSLFVVSAREKRILKRLQATPAGAGYILAGRIVPAVLISFVQSAVLLSIAVFGFGVKITGNPGVLAIGIGFGALVFVCLGFLVSSVSKSVDSAESLTNVITLPMFFLGGVFIPLERLPPAVQAIGAAMPLTYFSDALRQVMLHGASFGEIWVDIVVLAGFAVLVFALAVKLFRWE
ncbi:MAG TPA: ABC transporter permease [Thermoplasmata archaeon]|jgi:ABC-2 type transport system permease protein|nr:ABC transporter permease [Thermoplasmata archaeon]